MILQDVLESYRLALRTWLPFLTAHLFIRLVVASLMVPVIGLLLALTLAFSGQSALTDQDIAKFLLTPAGAIGALVILSLLVIALVLDVLVATAILRQRPAGPLTTLALATRFTLASAPRLLPFVSRFLLRVLLIVLPFVIAGGAIANVFLTEHDINYYLTERPSDFLIAVGLTGLILLALALILLSRLSAWAIAMHLVVFDGVSAPRAFADSAARMDGHRAALTQRLVVWLLIRALIATAIGAIAAMAVTMISGWSPDSLRTLAAAMVLNGLLYAAANAVLNAVSNGALADLLNAEFDRALAGRQPTHRITASDGLGGRERAAIAVVGVAALMGLGTGGLLAERLKQDAQAEVIAHRGAAALAPENTMASVLRAIEDGADWIEIDVQESADGEVIVAHDSDFMKSSGVPTKVWNATAADLAEIDVGSWFDPAYSGERVPRLADVLAAAKDRAGVVIELKYYGHDEDLERRVAAIVEEAGMSDQISTMSLKFPAVQKMRALRPEWRTGVLAATSIGDLTGLEGDFLALNQARINARVIARANAQGKDVYAWTVNDPMSMVRMLWLGVNGLITDDPALAGRVIEGYNGLTVAERLILALSDRVSITIDPGDLNDLRP
ncbi:glycerophosphodiester phosphodiesterase family protein [Ovoidimarina sediminis]|uniref:glycerophosphodiester phosphodiesterase family protein n=1 Tax=Ovoidimarina sediminis TaxID=3079856 RepID=UPI00290771CE|nr:glycerophosphodiester phosphodiesterase family protein [Rhodophyticola sp. MJ-SS7]MDU8944289.1 glycerophosphodiester phosphodiesterase family protein [Rhodophyticola sp. MJ-SS7]